MLALAHKTGIPFVFHAGDVFSEAADSCRESAYLSAKSVLYLARAPLIVLPGDNETSNCPDPASALRLFRKYFIPPSPTALGELRQSRRPENVEWTYKSVTFIGLSTPNPALPGAPDDDREVLKTSLRSRD